MTRFGVMKHLAILEEADLVTTGGRAREAPLPEPGADPSGARPLDQQVRRAGRRCDVRHQGTLESPMDTIDHVYSVYIKAPPDRVWRAITDGNETVRYYYGTRVASDWGTARP
jgi:hypothetical protein